MPKSRQSFSLLPYVGVVGGVLLAVGFLALGFFLGRHQPDEFNPYQVLKGYEGSRHAFLVKSAELSVKMTGMAIEELKKKDLPKAVEDCRTAIDLFPIDAKPYILLTKLYLMTGQERKMYDTLSLAGNSYPNFNNIVDIIDDEDLDRIPLEQPADNVYLANFPENKKSAVSFMFDDGEADVYKALAVFDKYGFKATIPVVAGFVSDTSNDPFWGSWSQWKDAANRGFEIANHSMFHRDSKILHGADFDVSIDQAKDTIERHIGRPVTAYVFPHDSYTGEAVSRALKTHKYIRTPEFLQSFYPRTVDVVIGGPHVSLDTAKRIADIGIKRQLWLVLKCHGVSQKRSMRSFKSITPRFLEDYLNYLHSRSGDIWVDTFSRVFDYLYQRAQTAVEIKAATDNSAEFTLHNTKNQDRLGFPLTVVIKTPQGAVARSAREAGRPVKAWGCGTGQLCVNAVAYDEDIKLEW